MPDQAPPGKKNLYEFLGVSPDAATEQIVAACHSRREEIAALADDTERRNALVFLRHAEETLCDPARRQRHDQQLAVLPSATTASTEPTPGRFRRRAVLALVSLLAVLAWGYGKRPAPASFPTDSAQPSGIQRDNASAPDPEPALDPQTAQMLASAGYTLANSPPGTSPAKEPATDPDVPATGRERPKVRLQASGPYARLLEKLT